MTSLVVALLVGATPHYPLATVFVRDGKLSLSEMGKREETLLPAPGIAAESASLNFSRTRVAFTGMRDGDETPRLFLLEIKKGTVELLPTGLAGGHRDAVFSTDEKYVYFTASESPTFDLSHPTRLRRWDLAKKRVEEAAPDFQPTQCEFHPAPRKSQKDVVHLSSGCMGTFMMQSTEDKWPTQRVTNPDMEIATSFDGTRTVYTSRKSEGLVVFVREGDKPERRALVLPMESPAIQPRFVCPRDVMFLKNGSPWVLNTSTLETSEAATHK